MKLSQKRRTDLFRAIHEEITDIRNPFKLKLNAEADYKIAQVVDRIWQRVCWVLVDWIIKDGE